MSGAGFGGDAAGPPKFKLGEEVEEYEENRRRIGGE
jgi:hypothetical protein